MAKPSAKAATQHLTAMLLVKNAAPGISPQRSSSKHHSGGTQIKKALEELGGTLDHVVRTRMYVTDITRDWQAIGRAHGEVFQQARPASTMVEVKQLIDPAMLVEIEVSAIVD